MTVNQDSANNAGEAPLLASGAGSPPDPSAAKKARAELLLKAKGAEAALVDATAVLTADQEDLAKLEAARANLPHEDRAIAAHVQNESIARIKVDLAQKALDRAKAAKDDLVAAAERSAIETRYSQIVKARQTHLLKFFEQFGPTMKALKALLVVVGDLDAESAELNKRLPKGMRPLGATFDFERGGPPARLEIRLLDSRRNVLWSGDEESSPVGGDR